MKASWRIFAFAGGLALAAGAGAACTVTTGSGDSDAGDLFGDAGQSGSDTGTGTDTGTTTGDSGTTTCTSRIEAVDGGNIEITFDSDGGSACDNCMDQNCCTELGACFQDSTGECQNLETCLQSCVETADAGGCEQDCADLHPTATSLHTGWVTCGTNHCNSVCPFQ